MPMTRKIEAPPGFAGCARCEQVKPVTAFNLHRKGGDRLMSYCKDCRKQQYLARRAALAGKPDPTAAERFWPKVDKSGGPDACWPWLGSRKEDGYGFFVYQARTTRAHRVALILSGVDVPEYDGGTGKGLVVDHICKSVSCCNPKHLRLVTQEDNCGLLANNTPHYVNRLKTVCKRGHPFVESNIYRAPRRPNMRQCRACMDLRVKGMI